MTGTDIMNGFRVLLFLYLLLAVVVCFFIVFCVNRALHSAYHFGLLYRGRAVIDTRSTKLNKSLDTS